MSRRLRVLVVLPAGVVGGAERWLLDLMAATDRLEVSAVVLAQGPVVLALREAGVAVRVLETGPRAVDGLRPARALRALLRHAAVDVVLANGVKAGALALPVAALLGVPAVWVRHDHSFGARLGRPLGRLATRVVVTDPQLLSAVGRADTAVVLPPAPGPTVPRPQARAELGLAQEGLVLAVVGRLVDYKGVDDAVRALADPRTRPWTLLVVGDDDPADPGERARLADLSEQLQVQDRVRFAGHVPRAGSRLSAADAVAVLTKPVAGRSPGVEGFGVTALEAASAGVPVIAVDGSPAALRLAGQAGRVVPAGDPGALAAALQDLQDPLVRAVMGRAGRSLSAGHPTAKQCAEQLVQVLAAAAGRSGAGLEGPPVSVVVTVRDEQQTVPGLLAGVLPQLRAHDELVVVDGGSGDATVALLRAAAAGEPRLTVLERPGSGISRGRNLAVETARMPVVVCTDAGCVPVPGWLGELAAAFAEDGAPALVTGVYQVTSGRPTWWGEALAAVGYPDPSEARRATPLVRGYGALFGRTFDPALPTGRSMAFSREQWERVGGFPEYLATGEDVLFGQRLVAMGGRAVLATSAEVRWDQRQRLRSNLRMYRSYGRGDGLTGSWLLVGRNVARLLAYPTGAALLVSGSRAARALAVTGAVAYLSLPGARAARRAPRSLLVIPLMAALRDGAKAWGCLDGLRARPR